ncbi:hypothetical protein [Cellulomonas xiejunii]|uniref:Uncharacterized protein n=1 Tax=Cellulomonas xiejunii TaxID=2968083 RepID=A0ABY5KMH1_9CELL|nr:hypothetical protein [Cellulomonas xiejunii]MCC2321109.1 hypothetical protein [Cellulomonas xiejunii]UUI71702.1 hypothetical protein NP048_18240 [Cellulomonas xiejunii]
MGMSIQIRNESRAMIRTWPERISLPIASLDPERFPLTSGINPYGDTVFNQTQVERVSAELVMWLVEERDEATRSALETLIEACASVHRFQYLWLVGE